MRRILRYFFLIMLACYSFESMAQTKVWQDIYEVKKKDTIYGISQKYGITMEELVEANPEMKQEGYKLKKGAKVFIPKKDEPKAKPQPAKMKTMPGQTLHVGVMLPLHDVDGDGKRMVEYYRGILMACDSLRLRGVNTDIHAWNVNIDSDIRVTLLDEAARGLDIIFGPLYTKQVKPLADFCKANDIKLVIPFSISAPDVQTNSHVYQVYQNESQLNDRAIGAYMGLFKDCNAVFIDCNDTTSRKGNFTFGLRRQLEAQGISYQITNLSTSEGQFQKAFSKTKKNVVILNTGRSPELNLAFRKLNELRLAQPNVDISMYGYNEWLSYESTYRELYHRYDVHIPSTYYYFKGLSRVQSFEQNYKRWFGVDLQDRYIPRFAITGYDHAMFFLRGLNEHGSAFDGARKESLYKHIQSPLNFKSASTEGGMQNSAFQLIHYGKNHVIGTIDY